MTVRELRELLEEANDRSLVLISSPGSDAKYPVRGLEEHSDSSISIVGDRDYDSNPDLPTDAEWVLFILT